MIAVADGRVVVWGWACGTFAHSTTVALDVATGRELWRHTGGGPPFNGPLLQPGTGNGVVVVPAGGDGVEGLDVASGEVLWSRPGVSLIGDGPEVVVVRNPAGSSENLSVLDRRTGMERWTVQPGYVVGVAATDSIVLVTGTDSTVAYDARTGEQRWEAPFTEGDEEPTFLVDDVTAGKPVDKATTPAANPVSRPSPMTWPPATSCGPVRVAPWHLATGGSATTSTSVTARRCRRSRRGPARSAGRSKEQRSATTKRSREPTSSTPGRVCS